MNSSKRGRTIALFTGAGVIGITVVALVFWKDLVAHYHLYRLRSDPDYLREIIRADEESPEHEAIHAHLDSQEGQQQLFDLYLPTFEEIKERATFVQGDLVVFDNPTFEEIKERATFVQGVLVVFDNHWMKGIRFEGGGSVSNGRLTSSEHNERLRSLSSYVSHLAGEQFMSDDYPELRFAFLSGDEVAKRSGCYVSLENGTAGRVDSGPRPPDWITKNDLEVYRRTTGLLIERVGKR